MDIGVYSAEVRRMKIGPIPSGFGGGLGIGIGPILAGLEPQPLSSG